MLYSSMETLNLGLMPGGKNASLSSSLKFVNELYGKVSQQISTFSVQRSTVNMTIAQLTASLSAHQPRNTSPKDHTGGSSPFVDTTALLTTVELEKRQWGYGSRSNLQSPKRARTAGSFQQSDPKTNSS